MNNNLGKQENLMNHCFKFFTFLFIFNSAVFANENSISNLKNYPNPFNPGEKPTTIEYQLEYSSNVTIEIFDLSWHLVRKWTIEDGQLGGKQGINQIIWDGKNSDNQIVTEGAYVCVVSVLAEKGIKLKNKQRNTTKIAVINK